MTQKIIRPGCRRSQSSPSQLLCLPRCHNFFLSQNVPIAWFSQGKKRERQQSAFCSPDFSSLTLTKWNRLPKFWLEDKFSPILCTWNDFAVYFVHFSKVSKIIWGDTRIWTMDLSDCSRLLYHWAISPPLKCCCQNEVQYIKETCWQKNVHCRDQDSNLGYCGHNAGY